MTHDTNIMTLVGNWITAIYFVCDYVEIYVPPSVIRCMADPKIIMPGGEFQFPEAGSRDALCSLIGGKVSAIRLQEKKAFEMEIDTLSKIIIPLDTNQSPTGDSLDFLPGPRQDDRQREVFVW